MRWDLSTAAPQFFRANGESARKGLMKTPVDGARLTSDFGMRFHPLLNYSRMHQGVDFGVPIGYPDQGGGGRQGHLRRLARRPRQLRHAGAQQER